MQATFETFENNSRKFSNKIFSEVAIIDGVIRDGALTGSGVAESHSDSMTSTYRP